MRVLLIDIETAPCLAYMWSLWKEIRSYNFVEKEWYMMCFSAKWLGSKEIISYSLSDFKGYSKNPEDDKQLLLKLKDLLDEADVIIAHNGINFDMRKINARLIANGITPPSPYKIIDTLQVVRKVFAFTSNRLNDLAQFFKIGKKNDTGGFDLWRKCFTGDAKSWKTMINYNRKDVVLLEKIYLIIRPFIAQHPNFGLYNDKNECQCPKCGSKKIQYRGYYYSNSSKFRRFVCTSCGGWSREKINILSNDKKKLLITNAM